MNSAGQGVEGVLGNTLVELDKMRQLFFIHQLLWVLRVLSQLVFLFQPPVENAVERRCLEHDPGVDQVKQ